MHGKRTFPGHGHGLIQAIRHFIRTAHQKPMHKVESSSGMGETSHLRTGVAVQAEHLFAINKLQ